MPETPLITIVDDDDSLRVALMGLVRSMGYRTEGFDRAEALLQVDPGRSSCIVTDIQMPGMSGIDLKKELDARGFTVPVIMITARAEPELHARARASNPVCLLRKPFDAAVLINCLESAVADGKAAQSSPPRPA